jgi:hypothetical protein
VIAQVQHVLWMCFHNALRIINLLQRGDIFELQVLKNFWCPQVMEDYILDSIRRALVHQFSWRPTSSQNTDSTLSSICTGFIQCKTSVDPDQLAYPCHLILIYTVRFLPVRKYPNEFKSKQCRSWSDSTYAIKVLSIE